jgi:hypothetical protein
LAPVFLRGELVGAGATCGQHTDCGVATACKKSVRFGATGLDMQTCMLRLKRWLIAGRGLPADGHAAHVAMGGPALRDYAAGLSEGEMEALL